MTIIETTGGRLRGLAREGFTEFRGIPFAAPTTGALRFAAPRPAHWQGVLEADRFAPAVAQELNPLMGVEQIAEDSLALNIVVPDGDGPKPVMVWFHGGGYLSGSPSQRLYDARRLATRRGVIVVNAAYRLGLLGFGWLSGGVDGLDAPGNAGLRDQIAALRWVNENIAGFGGDPGRVTIFGESAGGFSVATLLAAPAAAPLFQRAILQSGAGDMVLASDAAAALTEKVIANLPGSGSAAYRLANLPLKELVRAQRAGLRELVPRGLRDTTPQFGMTFLPVVDGDLLPELPVQAIANGAARDKAIMAGVCRDEWHLFQYAPPFNGGAGMDKLRALGEAELEKRFMRALPQHGAEALALYRDMVTPDPRRSLLDLSSAMESDRLFRVPTLRLLDAQVAAGGAAWGFQFEWEVEAFGVPLGACHVVDVPLVFDLVETPMGQLFTGGGQGAVALADRVGTQWAAFARGDSPDWVEWGNARQLRRFAAEDSLGPMLTPQAEALWHGIIPPTA